MLTASPKHSPSPSQSSFKYNSTRNGSSVSLQPTYSSSPRSAAALIPKSPKAVARKTPPLRANYQDASTQYSPMTEAPRHLTTVPQLPFEELHNPSLKDAGASQAASMPTADSVLPPTSIPSTTESSTTQSPTVRRRQFKESADVGLLSATALSSAPKRPKSSKNAPKVLPVRYEFCDVEDIVILIADMISELIQTNDNLPLRDVVLTRFHSR